MAVPRGFFPEDTAPLHHQVGGHAAHTPSAFLSCSDGTILKLLQSCGRGEREVAFYRQVYDPDCSSQWLIQLRQFIPTFHGVVSPNDAPSKIYMQLEDVAAGYRYPCVLDIKMGRHTYDPLADAAKIARELVKYPPAQKIGFQLRGMQIYDWNTLTFTKYGKERLRLYTEANISDGLKSFFQNGRGVRKDLISLCLPQLRDLLQWFQNQQELSFFASSLLIAYDGFCKNINELNNICSDDAVSFSDSEKQSSVALNSKNSVRIRMIDFTHVFPLNGKSVDENYLTGLENLVDIFEKLLV